MEAHYPARRDFVRSLGFTYLSWISLSFYPAIGLNGGFLGTVTLIAGTICAWLGWKWNHYSWFIRWLLQLPCGLVVTLCLLRHLWIQYRLLIAVIG
jgi:hypothetical protein